ncbi:MAG: hypothetical protein KAS93_08070 [Gammaproteobacteria bacterium]|nr:hypothetical protein [Gammaproteobacteria bacterium]
MVTKKKSSSRDEVKKAFCQEVDKLAEQAHTGKAVVTIMWSDGGVIDAYLDLGQRLVKKKTK